jgi:hypothetical protein
MTYLYVSFSFLTTLYLCTILFAWLKGERVRRLLRNTHNMSILKRTYNGIEESVSYRLCAQYAR